MSAGFCSGRNGRLQGNTDCLPLSAVLVNIIIFFFSLWPVIHPLYVSMHKWNIKTKS